MRTGYLLLALLIFLSACGEHPTTYVNPQTQTYVDSFLAEGELRGESLSTTNLVVDFTPSISLSDGQRAIGVCNIKSNGQKEVLLDQKYFAQASEADRMVLIDHELGHCLLGRKHVNSLGSMMYPHTPDVVPYVQSQPSAYLDELFAKEAPPSELESEQTLFFKNSVFLNQFIR